MTTLTAIKKAVTSTGGTYKKLKIKLNGNDAYEVNGMTLTKSQMIQAHDNGAL